LLLFLARIGKGCLEMGRAHEVIRRACAERGAALLGVLNVTPDSFFDGGRYLDAGEAKARVDELLEEGADILEIGAESSRPGSREVPAQEQLHRALPALAHAVERGAVVSIDTTSPEVAREALRNGAQIINDVSCLANAELASVVAAFSAVLIIMHSRGSMQNEGYSQYPDAGYSDVVGDICREWEKARRVGLAAGIDEPNIWFDPGLGFHKNARQSLEILARLNEFHELRTLLVVGASRKSFLGSLDGAPPDKRLGGSIASALACRDKGAHLIRVHDVQPTRQALLIARALRLPLEEPAHA
jgi:dihydropteroate synthase